MEKEPKMPSKKRRLEIYKNSLIYIEEYIICLNSYHMGLCFLLSTAIKTSEPRPYFFMDKYPEIYKHRPKEYNGWWFPCDDAGDKKRIKILKQAIKELETK